MLKLDQARMALDKLNNYPDLMITDGEDCVIIWIFEGKSSRWTERWDKKVEAHYGKT